MDSKEWLDDYMSLKQVNPHCPFTVPAGYFEELYQNTLSRAAIDGADAGGIGFMLPLNYFEEMQANLQSRINMEAALEHTAGDFTVPENYFEEMQASLQSRIRVEEALQQPEGFIVPENYFENLQQQITSRVAVDEILSGQPEGFTVPENYFDGLQQAIMAKAAQPQAPRRGIVHRMFTSGAFKYAAAACVTLAIGGTLFFRQLESPMAVHNRSYIHKALSDVPDEDIIDYLQMHMDAADTRGVMDEADQINTNDVNAEDLKNYLSTH